MLIMKILKWLGVLFFFIIVVYLLGPKPDYPLYDLQPKYLKVQLQNVDEYVSTKESKIADLKEDNNARVVWYNDTLAKTEYSLVYLHGFSASHGEGDLVHRALAERYGMNLYLARLADHGRFSKDSFKELTPKDLIVSAKEAIAIGGLIGEKVILMSCSTGGTLSVMLAGDDPRVHSLIMYSPNIGIKDPSAKLVTYPWGEQILKLVMGGEHNIVSYSDEAKQYWNEQYHTDGIIALQALIDDGMNIDFFKEFTKPYFIGCYYRDEEHQDEIVSVEEMNKFYISSATISNKKEMKHFANVNRHVFTSKAMVKEADEVLQETFEYCEKVLNLSPI